MLNSAVGHNLCLNKYRGKIDGTLPSSLLRELATLMLLRLVSTEADLLQLISYIQLSSPQLVARF